MLPHFLLLLMLAYGTAQQSTPLIFHTHVRIHVYIRIRIRMPKLRDPLSLRALLEQITTTHMHMRSLKYILIHTCIRTLTANRGKAKRTRTHMMQRSH